MRSINKPAISHESVGPLLKDKEKKNHGPRFHGSLHQGGYRERHRQQSHAFDWDSSLHKMLYGPEDAARWQSAISAGEAGHTGQTGRWGHGHDQRREPLLRKAMMVAVVKVS